MSKPLKLKVTGTVLCSVFQLPDHGFIGQFAGAYRKCFALNELDGLRDSAWTRLANAPSVVDSRGYNFALLRHDRQPPPIRCHADGFEA